MSKNRRRLSLGLAAFCVGATACTTTRPVYDEQGRYSGYTKEFDEGKALAGFGALNGGLFGLLMQAGGNKVSEDKRRETEHDYRSNVQRQIDNTQQQAVEPQSVELPQYVDRRSPQVIRILRDNSSFFACNYWNDSNGDMCAAYDEFVGVKSSFRTDERVTFVSRMFNAGGLGVLFQLYNNENVVVERETTPTSHNHVVMYEFGPGELKPLGVYTAVWTSLGVPMGYTRIKLWDSASSGATGERQEAIQQQESLRNSYDIPPPMN